MNNMSISNNQLYDDSMNDIEDVANLDSSSFHFDPPEQFLEPFKTDEDFPNVCTSFLTSSSIYMRSLSEVSSEMNVNTNSSSTPFQVAGVCSLYIQPNVEHLQIIEQPCQSSKLRYRADYIREKTRLGVLTNRNEKSKIKGPAIKIPQSYLDLNDQYYVRVSLVIIKHKKTNLHYFHPYEIENPSNEQLNDRQNNVVWFPIDRKDSMTGIKSFPLLRIVKKKAVNVQKLDHLRIFDCNDQNSQNHTPQQFSPRTEIDMIEEYNLERSQLAFTIGKKILTNGQSSVVLYPQTTVFSTEMDEDSVKQFETDSDTESLTDKTSALSCNRHIYKYAPRSGFAESNEEVLVFLKNKLEPRKFGNLQVTMECDTTEGHWSESVVDLEIKDRMISFKTPFFPYPITETMPVDIILKQDIRILGILKYSYVSTEN